MADSRHHRPLYHHIQSAICLHGGAARRPLCGGEEAPRLPLPFVYEAFPDLLQPISSAPQEVLTATMVQRWRERATRIHDDLMSWVLCEREWLKENEKEKEEGDPVLRSRVERFVQVCRAHTDRELRNLARRIHFEATEEERARMPPFPLSPSIEFVQWARGEAKSEDLGRRERWKCILGLSSTSIPSYPAQVDPLPYLSPEPA